MMEKKLLTLNQIESGRTGTVVRILGGRHLIQQLEAMGIRPGRKVTKISTMFFRGPVSLKVDNTTVAIGFGMASKIVVEPDTSA